MTGLWALVRRNTKLFFKDTGMFVTSLISPLIILVLYATFLAKVYKDSFLSAIPEGLSVPESLIDGTVGTQLLSSLLAVSCVTISFGSNMLMVDDKVKGARMDLTVSPVKGSTLALGYYISTLFSTLIICYVTTFAGIVYLNFVGWQMTLTEILYICLDVFLLTMFGTALSSVIFFFMSTPGQLSAVGTIVSAGYGFICGAYMPIANFSESLQKVISLLPGTYGTVLIRNHTMNGVFEGMRALNFPEEVVQGIRDGIDCNLYFFGDKVEISTMYIAFAASAVLLVGLYVLFNMLNKRSKSK